MPRPAGNRRRAGCGIAVARITGMAGGGIITDYRRRPGAPHVRHSRLAPLHRDPARAQGALEKICRGTGPNHITAEAEDRDVALPTLRPPGPHRMAELLLKV